MKRLMKAAIVVLAVATSAAPLAAQAQSHHHHERRHDGWRGDRPHHNHDWRQNQRQNPGWRGDGRWSRSNPNWWRGRAEFRDYHGARPNHWYAPGYGYYSVQPRYYGQRWTRGAYLPSAYRTYYVRDPAFYGLRPAPRGYRYVHADRDIVMIAVATGLIASVLNNVY